MKYRHVKIKVKDMEQSEQVQIALFKEGAEWVASGSKIHKGNHHTIWVSPTGIMWTGVNDESGYKEVSAEEVISNKQFQVGDKVRAFGCDGFVTKIETAPTQYPVLVRFNTDYNTTFTPDGRLHTQHKEPSLMLIERPIRKVRKTFWLWANERGVIDDTLMDENFTTPTGRVRPSYTCTKIPGTEVTLEVPSV